MAKLLRRLHAHCMYGFPRPLLPAGTATEALRRYSLAERYRLLHPLVRAGLYLLACVGYPVAVAGAAVAQAAELRRRHPGTPPAEGLRMYTLALLRNVPPVEYVQYGFVDPARRELAADYLYWTDTPALQRLNRRRGAVNADVQDKARFAALCRAAELPHVAMLAETRAGKQVAGPPLDELRQAELWVKPTAGSAGRGSRGWIFDGADTYRSGAEVLTSGQWHDYLLATDNVVQERQVNHPGLAQVTNRADAVFRLTTAAHRSGEASLIGAGVALPFGPQDDTAGAIACTLSLETGELLTALDRRHQPVAAHPDTGCSLPGFHVPLWEDCVALVLRAHRAFPRFATLGWDVVITPEGPLLLEANSGWNPLGLQYHFGPLGRTELGTIIAEDLGLAG